MCKCYLADKNLSNVFFLQKQQYTNKKWMNNNTAKEAEIIIIKKNVGNTKIKSLSKYQKKGNFI